MPSQADEIQHLKAMAFEELRDARARVLELEEFIKNLEHGASLLSGKYPTPPPPAQPSRVTVIGAKVNAGVTQKVREYLDAHDEGKYVNVKDLCTWLVRNGVSDRGKPRSLDSQVRVILRKEKEAKRLGYEAGEGYFKPVREDGSDEVAP